MDLPSIRHLALACCAAFLAASCTTGIDPSPDPGIVRVTIHADDTDTSIVIQNDTLGLNPNDSSGFSRYNLFNLILSQAKVYRDTNFAPLYVDPSNLRITGDTVNILARDYTTGNLSRITAQNSAYHRYVIFESYAPPGDYNQFEVSITGTKVSLFGQANFEIPLMFPPNTNALMDFPATIHVQSNRVTQIDLVISPFKSLSRYKDSFIFDRKVVVGSVVNP